MANTYTSDKYIPLCDSKNELCSIPVKVRFIHMNDAPALKGTVLSQAAKLEHFNLRNPKCSVVIDRMHQREKMAVYEVRARLRVSGEPLYVARSQPVKGDRDEVHAAIAEVFERLEHQVEKEHTRRLRKRHGDWQEYAA